MMDTVVSEAKFRKCNKVNTPDSFIVGVDHASTIYWYSLHEVPGCSFVKTPGSLL